ncbi:e5f1779d-a72c-4734-b211-0d363d187b48 [Sclerotinia trifoliorum]|uniref:E5f1779d-a72c-4734-b211-0d363d187b48 n=1 Tax=Sclerotinia trifoliorum TaxID=28548 RepID=A0A8H2VQL7_9HELO|nr:e5f1779d-a72c-4734-b211-0d363d187b48 [Sclerotinia trifoliorum]
MSHLSPETIFSPTVARQQLAAAKDWSYIDNWLSIKFANQGIPSFERNPSTLKALLSLASLNETADEEQELLARSQEKALTAIQTSLENDPNAELLHSLEDSLTPEGQTSLETLASLSTTLNLSTPSPELIGRKLLSLQTTSYTLSQASSRVATLQRSLTTEMTNLSTLIASLQSPSYQASTDLPKQTVDLQRKAKILSSKLPEIRERIAALSSSSNTSMPKVTVETIKAEEEKFKEWLKRVKDLETQVKAFHGLPQDVDLARLELESLRMELRDFTRERDGLFEGLVERESPKKRGR